MKSMEDYIHIYKIPRSYTQEIEENRDSRTESFLDNRKSRHDYEPVNFDRGESGTSQRPQVDDENLRETKNSEKKYIKQQIRRSFCIYSIIVAITLSSLMVLVAVSLTIIAIRSNAVSDQVADIQQQVEELQLVWVKLINTYDACMYL